MTATLFLSIAVPALALAVVADAVLTVGRWMERAWYEIHEGDSSSHGSRMWAVDIKKRRVATSRPDVAGGRQASYRGS